MFARLVQSFVVTSTAQIVYMFEDEKKKVWIASFWSDLKRNPLLSPQTSDGYFAYAYMVLLEFPRWTDATNCYEELRQARLTARGQQLHERFRWILAGLQSPRQSQSREMSKRHLLVKNVIFIPIDRQKKVFVFNSIWQEVWQKYLFLRGKSDRV